MGRGCLHWPLWKEYHQIDSITGSAVVFMRYMSVSALVHKVLTRNGKEIQRQKLARFNAEAFLTYCLSSSQLDLLQTGSFFASEPLFELCVSK